MEFLNRIFMKTVFYFILIAMLFVGYGCKENNTNLQAKNSVNSCKDVELAVAKSLSTKAEDVKLMGYKTFYVDDEDEREKLKELAIVMKDSLSNYFIAEDGSYFRIYFPLHTAIVVFNDSMYYADEKGIVKTNEPIKTELTVIGRKLSEIVRGTGSNIIVGDRLLLETPLTTNPNISTKSYMGTKNTDFNYCVFDLGIHNVDGDCCDDDVVRLKTKSESGKVSCWQNHGLNCSYAFGINNGRCTLLKLVCMDYNGWFTDCQNGKVSNFPRSDCSEAMIQGHCWNELM